MLRQTQQQKLLQKLSPQQIQLMKLLQIPTANLEERIKEELEINPALEQGSDQEDDEYNLKDSKEEEEEYDDVELSDDNADTVDLDDYLRHEDDDNINEYNNDYYGNQDNEQPGTPVRVETGFHDYLLNQVQMLGLDEQRTTIAHQIIGSIDEDGYLRREIPALVDDLAFGRNIITTEQEVKEIIESIQQFDPAGVCAYTLQECLHLQLERIEPRTSTLSHALDVVDKHFNEFTKKHYDKIQKHLGVDNDEIKNVINTIIKLNPKPGSAFAIVNKAESYILPDFFVYNNNGKLELSLNSKNAPELRVSGEYKDMMRAYDEGNKKDKRQKEAVMFIKQKLDSAKWFIDAIKQRQHTLMQTMQAIVGFQKEFFLTGDDMTLRPMILKDIAEITLLDVSTVSRVANSKYVQTEFGTFKLKYFFSESLQTESGEEVSTREVKSILQGIIDEENKRKPYSDEKLTQMLQDKGYNIARRTVAKYREQLNIPVARLRKEL
ncbi:MAG: RNA polymerase factor sigma-54 [Chitinophagales bacterium]|nr:RNA polymerase factor sigma-54 [Chitinophagaceae bacterium]MCB9065754.1 RNA polymerase factor sigma-54 [Chitinophagales bacterium]